MTTAAVPTTVVPTTEAPTTTTADIREVAVLAALAGYNQAFSDAAQPFDPEHPDLERFITDPLLSRIQNRYAEYADLGYEGQGGFRYDVISIEIEGDFAKVVQCAVDETSVVDGEGEFVFAPDEQAFLYFTELVLLDLLWKVSKEGKVGGEDQLCDLG